MRRLVVASVAGGVLLGSALSAGPASARPADPSAGSTQTGNASLPTIGECRSRFGSICLTPAQLRQAYGVDSLVAKGITGKGVTIGIVDSFGSPTLEADLDAFDQAFGLPPVDLEVVAPAGASPPFDPGDADMAGWALETTLDVEVAHSIAPGAKIVVITTPVSETEGLQGFPEIVSAEHAMLGRVDVLSQSFAATEPTFTSPDVVRQLSEQVYPAAKASGVSVLSSSGDSGPTDLTLDMKSLYSRPVTVWPASDPLVTAVGGTHLGVGTAGTRTGPDRGWSGSGAGGGGVSEIFTRPAFQSALTGVPGAGRAVPDISLDADPATGLLIYVGGQWRPGGGTSHAAPLLAALVALADQAAGARIGYLNDALYRLASAADEGASSGIVDVTLGSNAVAGSSVPGYPARPGYDLATGLGTLDASKFVPAIVAATADQHQPLASSAGASPSAGPFPVPASSSDPPPAGASPVAAGPGPGGSEDPGPGWIGLASGALLLAVIAAVTAVRRRRAPP